MKRLSSIEKVEIVKETQCRPFVVSCNDFNDYLYKYSTIGLPASKLARELLVSRILTIFGFYLPTVSIIDLKIDHFPDNAPKSILVGVPGIGFLYLSTAKEVDKGVEIMLRKATERRKLENREQVLLLGLIDIWLGNEDRHEGNYNLLYQLIDNKYRFVPIDHETCFNSGNEFRTPYTINENETLLLSGVSKSLFRNSRKFADFLKQAEHAFSSNLDIVEYELSAICKEFPDEWQIPGTYEEVIRKRLFDPSWVKETMKIFKYYCQLLKA